MFIVPANIPTTGGYVPAGAIWLDGVADYLKWTPSGAGTSSRICTFSFLTKRTELGDAEVDIINCDTATATQRDGISFGNGSTADCLSVRFNDATAGHLVTNALYRDPTAWQHWVVAIDTTQATASDRVKIYLNGVRITSFATETYPSQNYDFEGFFQARDQHIGSSVNLTASYFLPAYLSDVIGIDGTQYAASDFGEYDTNNNWVPKNPTGLTFGTNGFWLDFANSADLGNDVSGNNNDFTLNSMSSANSTSDRTADKAADNLGNYCTGNPLFAKNTANDVNTWTEGNTKIAASSSHNAVAKCSIGIPSNATGKWYFEATPNIGANVFYIGLAASNYTRYPSSGTQNLEYRSDNGNKVDETNTSSAYGASYTSGDVIGVEYDADTDTLTFYKNGSSQGAAWTDVSNRLAFPIFPYCFINNGSGNTFKFNFGATAWTYAPASVQEISTANLPAPTVTKPDDYFKTVLYTGTGATLSVTGLDFQPDFVWIKTRSTNTTNHQVYDAVRGATKYVKPNSTGEELTYADTLTSFDSGGFSLGADASSNDCNFSGRTYVAWCLKANGAGSSNTDGTETVTVSAAVHGGFSIITGTTKSTAGSYTYGHGLSRAPALVIHKPLVSGDWHVYSEMTGADKYLYLNGTAAPATSTTIWDNTAPSSTVIYENTAFWSTSINFVTYAFARTPGLIGIGSYTGNGSSTDGPYVVVDDGGSGFRPAFVMYKNINIATNWTIVDAKRNTYNVVNIDLYPNNNGPESVGGGEMDFTANGFKIRASGGGVNGSGNTHIYLAFAEYPFGGEGVAQAKAR